ncbi:SDR family oxidoreductase [Lactococcus formosensis]|jgi:3-oxoacyl-[acyl-carrier protein] reductase|uniref:SDR family oxidoreductase n=1 Tax=Lactococcus formosensis TaxID=1281486 RepID=A0A9Q8Y470_9LACT|nr:SDR family oxidoreductase [Lactococcus formosensis]USJ21441.1 SDR family oxidoreductase [Lactococcus formosensis]
MENMTINNRVALVLGGTGGIGRAIVEKLSDNGYKVVIHYSSNKDKAHELAQDIQDRGGDVTVLGGDISSQEEMSILFDTIISQLGGIDVVINTVGIMKLSSIATLDLNEFDLIQKVNVRGTFIVSQQAALKLRSGGAIINFSTSVTRTSFPNYSAYVASKAAVESLTLILAKELRGRDITVNTVSPGPTATPLFLEGKDEKTINHLAQATPLERIGVPEDIAETVAFLAGPARWVNGQVIFTNGGLA